MVSSQIIDVINELCSKFGIAIDWSQKNVQPYLESLVTKAVNYELYTSIMWIVIGAILIGISLFYLSKANRCKERYIKYKKDYTVDTESDYTCKELYRILGWFFCKLLSFLLYTIQMMLLNVLHFQIKLCLI